MRPSRKRRGPSRALGAIVVVGIIALLVVGGLFATELLVVGGAVTSVTKPLEAGDPAQALAAWKKQSSLPPVVRARVDTRVRALIAQRTASFAQAASKGPLPDNDPAILEVSTFAEQTTPVLAGALDKLVAAYTADASSTPDAATSLSAALTAAGLGQDPTVKAAVEKLARVSASRKAFAKAQQAEGKPFQSLAAANLYSEVVSEDAANYALAQQRIPALKKKAATELVEYKGPVQHIFTHVLIAWPGKAAKQPRAVADSTDTDHITPLELKRLLQQLYDNHYVLVDINSVFKVEGTGADTKVVRTKLMLPPGKKPLIYSIDDVRYDPRTAANGFIDRLIVDDSGKIASFTKGKNTDTGKDVISYDNEVFPIVETFIAEHPDFSFNGARGTLAMTGYESLFGYRTHRLNTVDRDSEIAKAKVVAARLKELGWNFASHGYAHLNTPKVTDDKLRSDSQKWVNETQNVVGPTLIYIWPFGAGTPYGSPKRKILMNEFGFRMFNTVGAGGQFEFEGPSINMERKPIDGYTLRSWRARYLPIFDTAKVFDSAVRSKLKPAAGGVK